MDFRKVCANFAAVAVGFGGLALVAPGVASAAEDDVDAVTPYAYQAAAWGSQVKIAGPLVNSDRTALAAIGCTRKSTASSTNTALEVEIPGFADLGEIATEAFAAKDGSTFTSTGRTTIEDVSLLEGLIVAEGLETEARAWKQPNGYHGAVDFTLLSLTVDGDEIPFNGDEIEIDIPGVGSLTVGHTVIKEKGNRSSALGNFLVLKLLDDTVVKVGNANASIDGRAPNGLFAGGAFGTQAVVLGTVEAGRTAVKNLPCTGTNGVDKTNTTAGSDLGDLGTVGAVTSTVNGDQGPPVEATVTNEVADVTIDLGVGELIIDGVVTQVHVIENEDGTVSSDIGDSEVLSITFDPLVGDEISIPVDPGTVFELPLDLGSVSVLVSSPYKGDRGLQLTGVLIELAPDTQIIIGSAKAAIKG